jgi:hypothetical protein
MSNASGRSDWSSDGFRRRARELVSRHPQSRSFADDISAALPEDADGRRFTVSLIGGMRAGKSTLLNALLGRHLAAIGVTETTATTNWFDFGPDSDMFDVYWRSGLVETKPLRDIGHFTGDSDRAQNVQHLSFTASSPLLKTMRLIDAPGLGSVIESHESQARATFTRNEGDTAAAAGRADAVIVVLAAPPRGRDVALLSDFEKVSRLPGQSPYNSITVIQKWEAWDNGDAADPVAIVEGVAAKYRSLLEGKVGLLLPVSGILFQMAAYSSDEVMERRLQDLATLADSRHTSDKVFRRLTLDEGRFTSEVEGAPVSGAARIMLYQGIRQHLAGSASPEEIKKVNLWPILRFVLRHARARGLATAQELRASLRTVSHIDQLLHELDTRFLRVAGLIKSGTALEKALVYCERSSAVLRDTAARRRAAVSTSGAFVGSRRPWGSTAVSSWATEARSLIAEDAEAYEATLRELDSAMVTARSDVTLLKEDLKQLDLLDSSGAPSLDQEVAQVLRTLFGLSGLRPHERLGLPDEHDRMAMVARADTVRDMLARFLRQETSRALRRAGEHAELRLQQIFDLLLQAGGFEDA